MRRPPGYPPPPPPDLLFEVCKWTTIGVALLANLGAMALLFL